MKTSNTHLINLDFTREKKVKLFSGDFHSKYGISKEKVQVSLVNMSNIKWSMNVPFDHGTCTNEEEILKCPGNGLKQTLVKI